MPTWIGAHGVVTPQTHDISHAFRLGSVHDERLATLAAAWLMRGRAAAVSAVCERTWNELVAARPVHAS